MNTINYWSVLVASAAAFIIGAVWYSPLLFGKEWMEMSKISEADVAEAKKRGLVKLYVAQFITTIVMFAIMAFLISLSVTLSASDGAFLGLLVWLGFVATEAVGKLLWERRPFKLILINAVGTLVSLVIGGAIIGGWH